MLIDRLGVERFTFKKLAEEINSTEAFTYPYFENRHRLLTYLIVWYDWMEYQIEIFTCEVVNPNERLKNCLRVLAEEKKYDPTFEFVNEEALHRIVIAELNKTYLTKEVDEDNKEGLFGGFKSVCAKIVSLIKEINPNYPFVEPLVSTVLITANQQLFLHPTYHPSRVLTSLRIGITDFIVFWKT
ncbi:MAG: TetR/AcrR family transcriptional regulator [Cyclobacteriaceae bacterium]|nr:TetR/AcrR family transcriptional regulator [Cyclobacteriaceae bacterium]